MTMALHNPTLEGAEAAQHTTADPQRRACGATVELTARRSTAARSALVELTEEENALGMAKRSAAKVCSFGGTERE
jgi:hypothetical protein